MTQPPLLSVCIPTFQRETFLEISLSNWARELAGLPDGASVELLVGDNAASDRVRALTEAIPGARYIGHPGNFHFNGNVHRLLSDHARGRYVWICGDDDFIHRDALGSVLSVLRENPDLDYFYLNHRVIPPSQCTPEELRRAETSPHGVLENTDVADRRLSSAAEIVPLAPGCFTGIYTSIWRREEALRAFEGKPLHAFETLESTLPHACHIARRFLHRPCYYFGKPRLTVSHSICYGEWGSIYAFHWLPRFYDLLEELGIPGKVLDPHRRLPLRVSWRKVAALWRQRHTPYGRGFSLIRFVSDNWRFPEFRHMVSVMSGIEKLRHRFRRSGRA